MLNIDSLNISDYEVLANLAGEVGLNSDEVFQVLESDKYGAEVRKEEESASKLRISSVPYFVFNNKYAVSDAQQPELFLEVLGKVRKEELSLPVEKFIVEEQSQDNTSSGISSDGKCEI